MYKLHNDNKIYHQPKVSIFQGKYRYLWISKSLIMEFSHNFCQELFLFYSNCAHAYTWVRLRQYYLVERSNIFLHELSQNLCRWDKIGWLKKMSISLMVKFYKNFFYSLLTFLCCLSLYRHSSIFTVLMRFIIEFYFPPL